MWSINYYGSGSGNGYAIDNLVFSNANPPKAAGPPGPSFVAYANPASVYTQDFDSLPYQPTNSVNTANPVTVNGVTYSLGDPFDFAYLVQTNGSGGLGLSNTMAGWYGLGNVLSRFGAIARGSNDRGRSQFWPDEQCVGRGQPVFGIACHRGYRPDRFRCPALEPNG